MTRIAQTAPLDLRNKTNLSPRKLASWVSWQILSALGIAMVTSIMRMGSPLWALPRDLRLYIGTLALAHLMAASVLTWKMVWGRQVRLKDVMMAVSAAYAVCGFLLFLGSFAPYSRSVFVVALFGSYVLATVPLIVKQRLHYLSIFGLVLAISGFIFVDETSADRPQRTEKKFETSGLYNLALTIHYNIVPSETIGGAVEPFGEGFLFATGDGALDYVEESPQDAVHHVRLPYRVPMNRDEFLADKAQDVPDGFRVADIMIEADEERIHLFASHHYWNREGKCYVIRVSDVVADRQAFLQGHADLPWKTLYETKPCMPLNATKFLFVGVQIGGRLVRLDENNILLSVGDGEYDGWNSKLNLPQDPSADFGKTIRIDAKSGVSTHYSSGHRNPQGLYVTPDSSVWLTEHGPRGGDELNLITDGVNYGWPLVTYGTEYGTLTWPLSHDQGRHVGYKAPVFAWTPSIGISSVIGIQQALFSLWRGDLLIGSLRARTLFRVRLEQDRVAYVEPVMTVGYPIRDLTEAPDGRIALLFDGGDVGMLSPILVSNPTTSDDSTTDELVLQQCEGCHSIGDGTNHGIGPDLRGVVGRPIASAPGYEYSAALRGLAGRWTPDRLDQFLQDPITYAPGTSMRTDVLPDPAVRKKLIDYLASQR